MQKSWFYIFLIFMMISAHGVVATPFDETKSIKISGLGAVGSPSTIAGTVKTNGYSLNVRTGPWGSIVGSLSDNAKVQIIGSAGDWYKISYKNKTRYIHKNYVSVSRVATKTIPAKFVTGKVHTPGAALNIRTGPWGSIVGTLSHKSSVKIIGSSGDWYKISFGGKTRYVHKNYVSTSGKTASQVAPAKASTGYVKTGGAKLNVRSGPWGSVVGKLSDGAKVTILGKSGDWYKISHGGKTRYVHKNYISSSKSSSSSKKSGSSQNIYKASVVGKSSGDGTAAGAITWARDQINGTKKGYNPNNGLTSANSKSWSGWCLAFVNSAYGRKKSLLSAYSAIKSYQKCKAAGKIHTDKKPPAGAVMFTGTTSTNPYGHIFIATGKMNRPNDPIIITTSSNGIKEMPMSQMWKGPAYLGWAIP